MSDGGEGAGSAYGFVLVGDMIRALIEIGFGVWRA